jgi:transposase InsO family protein
LKEILCIDEIYTAKISAYKYACVLLNFKNNAIVDIIHSMSEPGTPVDNAVIESFHKSIKTELNYPNRNKTKTEMKVLIHDYLTGYYVNLRIHTKFQKTPKRHEEEIRASLNFV